MKNSNDENFNATIGNTVLPAVPSSEVYLEDCVKALKPENELLKTRVDKKQNRQLITFKPFFGNTVLAEVAVLKNKLKN